MLFYGDERPQYEVADYVTVAIHPSRGTSGTQFRRFSTQLATNSK